MVTYNKLQYTEWVKGGYRTFPEYYSSFKLGKIKDTTQHHRSNNYKYVILVSYSTMALVVVGHCCRHSLPRIGGKTFTLSTLSSTVYNWQWNQHKGRVGDKGGKLITTTTTTNDKVNGRTTQEEWRKRRRRKGRGGFWSFLFTTRRHTKIYITYRPTIITIYITKYKTLVAIKMN